MTTKDVSVLMFTSNTIEFQKRVFVVKQTSFEKVQINKVYSKILNHDVVYFLSNCSNHS